MANLIVLDDASEWPSKVGGADVVAARDYLADSQISRGRGYRVFNLCKSYRYQTTGYYVSLLATARGHRPLPDVSTMLDFTSRNFVRLVTDDVEAVIQRSLGKLSSNAFELSIYFGRNVAKRHDALSRTLFNLFPAPLLRASFVRTRGRPWQLQRIRPIPYGEIPESHYGSLLDSMEAHFGRRQRARPRFATGYDLAILVDKEEKDPPSNAGALRHFAAAAKDVGFSVETLTKEDYGRIAEFDALFIRATTRANHYTYRFARRAAVEGLAVIDDPDSIIRCTNKVYLAELMQRRRIPTPPTFLVHRDNREQVGKSLGYPVVLKRPDSAFSAGVEKADDPASLETAVKKFLETSDLVVAQAFLPTQFDWRVGTLGGQPLFVCRYYMAGGHWQIYHHGAKRTISGDADTLPVEEAPEAVVQVALKAANAIGAGLYGVDVKERDGKYYVIEVNDNPNLDSGVEDQVLGKELYLRIMGHMMGLVRARKNGPGNG